MHKNTPPNYSVVEACQCLGIGKTTFYSLISDKHLKVMKIGRRTLISEQEIERFLSSLQPAGCVERSSKGGAK